VTGVQTCALRVLDAARDDLRGLFELETLHRRGPASLVWLARDLEFDQPVALKLMPRTPGAGVEVEEAFHRAAALVAGLDHPHVVPWSSEEHRAELPSPAHLV